MIGIYWDTSTEWIVVEVFEFSSSIQEVYKSDSLNILYSYKESKPKEASTQLVIEIRKALLLSQISRPDWIFVAIGPGSFTGIRIATATARNLSQLWNIPCQGLDTMQLYMLYYSQLEPTKVITTIMKSNSDRYFVGLDNNTIDWTANELKEELNILTKNKKNLQIYSHNPIDWDHKLFSVDYPRITGVPINFYWSLKHLETDGKEFQYDKLFPKYMRESYATKPIPKN